MKDYMITDDTLVICPNGKYGSIVFEKNGSFPLEISPRVVINKNCLMYGSSLIGRYESTAFCVGNRYKMPLVISEVNNIILFPTRSPRLRSCIWVNFFNIKTVLKDELDNHGIIEFIDGTKFDLDISFYVLNNQYNRALRMVLEYMKKR